MKKEKVQVVLDSETKRKLEQLASEQGRTVKRQIETVVRWAVEDVELTKPPAGFGRKAKKCKP